jgi:hypothetical protein
MIEFERFLAAHGTPLPAVGARLSVHVQFVCGVLFILGLGPDRQEHSTAALT